MMISFSKMAEGDPSPPSIEKWMLWLESLGLLDP
jgi:hypothetical protein